VLLNGRFFPQAGEVRAHLVGQAGKCQRLESAQRTEHGFDRFRSIYFRRTVARGERLDHDRVVEVARTAGKFLDALNPLCKFGKVALLLRASQWNTLGTLLERKEEPRVAILVAAGVRVVVTRPDAQELLDQFLRL